jgi:S1-C subfamily serine protease
MKDLIIKFILLITVFMTFIGCSSCITATSFLGPGSLFREKRKSFIKIDVHKNILVTKTSSTARVENYELDLRTSASGFVVGHDRDITLIATSAHVCTITFENQINYFISDYSSRDPSWKLNEKSSFLINDYKGSVYVGFPIAFDVKSDICILVTSLIPTPALKISRSPPLIGEKYYNIAAPMGLWSSKMIPLFEGFYLGTIKIRKHRMVSYAFSIPTKGGSSGSPILNSYGEVIGATHSAYRGFENLCMATTNEQIRQIYQRAMKKILKNYKRYKLIIDVINI